MASEHNPGIDKAGKATSGVEELDLLIGGGLDRGTSTLVMGPAGSGKSTLAMQYVLHGLAQGERALFISFDETRRNFFRRATGVGMDFEQYRERFTFLQVDPAELSPGELSCLIRRHVEVEKVSIVTLDSLSGYQNAMPEEQFPLLQTHGC